MRVTLKCDQGTILDLDIWNLVLLHMLNSGISNQYSLAVDVSACVLTVDNAPVPYPYTSDDDEPAAGTGTTKPGLGAPRSLRSADAFDCAGSV